MIIKLDFITCLQNIGLYSGVTAGVVHPYNHNTPIINIYIQSYIILNEKELLYSLLNNISKWKLKMHGQKTKTRIVKLML